MKRVSRTSRYQLEPLESRRLLSALIVSSAADSGAGSLRAQIAAAAPSGDTISFAPSLAGQTITLTSGKLAIAKSLTIQGPGADQLIISGNHQSGVFSIPGSTNHVAIRDLTIAHGSTSGIVNFGVLTISNSTLTANVSDFGGAIFNSGTLTISSSTLSDNAAIGYTDGAGGAIYSSAGAVTISNCTITGNGAHGGSHLIYAEDISPNGYSQGYNGYGGALYMAGGTVSIDHSTIAGNYASGGYGNDPGTAGVGYYGAIAGGQVSNSIVAGNYADQSPDGGFTSLGHNLIGNSLGVAFTATDLLDVNPQLGPLQNNGGRTKTMALFAGSPAINAGDNTNAPAYDQRGTGFPRIVGGATDIGAFETSSGAGKTWIGPANGGNWSNAANWSPGGVPTANSVVSITGAAITLSTSTTVGGLNLSGGATLTLASNGNRVLRTPGLNVSSDSKLNLNDNALIIDYADGASPLGTWHNGSFDGLTGLIASGRNAGAWDGFGILTTQPDALSGLTTLGIGDASLLLGLYGAQTGLFSDQTVDATTVLVRYTFRGDANLDRRVDVHDLNTVALNWLGTGKAFSEGDFNDDGVVNKADLGIVAVRWHQRLDPLPPVLIAAPTNTAARVLPAAHPHGLRVLSFDETCRISRRPDVERLED